MKNEMRNEITHLFWLSCVVYLSSAWKSQEGSDLAYFSEISSIFGTDKLFSVTYGPLLFLLFIKALAGGNYSVLLYVTWC